MTVFPLPTTDASVNTTVEVEPLAATEDTITGDPLADTENALAGARGSRRVSLKFSVNVRPFAASVAELNVGDV